MEITAVKAEIEAVMAKIEKLRKEIEAVNGKIKSARENGDQSALDLLAEEKLELREEVQRLGKREEQLGKEEEQLREEKLKLISVSQIEREDDSLPGISQRVKKYCEDFGDNVRDSLSALSREESQFKQMFVSSKVPVCTLDGKQPCLLWEEDTAEGAALAADFLDSLRQDSLTIFLAPSGAGKTRTLIELGCNTDCLYFVGKELDVGPSGQGSHDLAALRDHLRELNPDPDKLIDPMDVECCIAAVVTARLFIKDLLMKTCPAMTNRDWTFFQLEYVARVRDVFLELSRGLLKIIKPTTPRPRAITAFRTIIGGLSSEWGGVVMVDEAQGINKWLPGRFRVADTEGRCSLMNTFLVGLGTLKVGRSVFMAGTGESMLSMKQIAETSGSLKSFRLKSVHQLKGFDTLEDMSKYIGKFVETRGLKLGAIFRLFQGRRRLIVSALEKFLVTPGAGTGTILEFAQDVCTKMGAELEFLHSLKDDVVKFMSRYETGALLRRLVCYYGEVPLYVWCDKAVVELLNCSLGMLVTEEQMQREAGLILSPGERGALGIVRIGEPLVRYAILRNMPEQERFQPLLDNQHSAGAIGVAYEICNCSSLRDYFKANAGKKLTELAELFTYYDPNYDDEPCSLLEPTEDLVRSVSEGYDLDSWLRDVEAGSAATFLHMGGDNQAGPDKICILRGDITRRMIPCLIQDKTGSLDVGKAFASINACTMYGNAVMTPG